MAMLNTQRRLTDPALTCTRRLFPYCRFFRFLGCGCPPRWPSRRGLPPSRPLRASRWPLFSFPLNLREKLNNRLRTSNSSWDLRTETSKFGGTQASSMEAACVPGVFRRKSCAYRGFWRFSTESLPLDRRSNARPGIRGSQAGYRAEKLGKHLDCPPNSIQRIGSGSQDSFRARMAVSMRNMVTVILITTLSLIYPSR